MSFAFKVNGHAGNGMEGNSEQEIGAVRALITELLDMGRAVNLNLTITDMVPPAWAPDTTNNLAPLPTQETAADDNPQV
jgi:hypothetical protein